MTELSYLILSKYQVRKTKAQKTEFIDLIKSHFPNANVQECGFPKSRNIIVGDVEQAEVLLSAHYDTCAKMIVPNLIFPKNIFMTLLYSILVVLPMFIIVFLVSLVLSFITDSFLIKYFISMGILSGLLLLMILGPANKHTANDNTSGVITLIELMSGMDDETKKRCAFIFFDNEEAGLLGSGQFRKEYGSILNDKLLINFDCVSDGDNLLFVLTKPVNTSFGENFEEYFENSSGKHIVKAKASTTLYPSDQLGFKNSIVVASLKKSKIFGYYMDRIHTKNDTVFDENNIACICEGTIKFIENTAVFINATNS